MARFHAQERLLLKLVNTDDLPCALHVARLLGSSEAHGSGRRHAEDALRIHFLQRTYELGREAAVDTQAVAAAVVDQYLSDTGAF